MVLTAGDREVELFFKAMRMELIGDKLGGDTQYKLQEASFDGNIKVLAMLIKQLSTEFTNVKDSDEVKGVYAFIDAMLDKNSIEKNSIADIYKQIFDGINEKGFFTPPLDAGAMPFNMKRMSDNMSTEMMGAVAKSQIGETLSAATAK